MFLLLLGQLFEGAGGFEASYWDPENRPMSCVAMGGGAFSPKLCGISA